jgi:transglutaminase-like putative cysteine protease
MSLLFWVLSTLAGYSLARYSKAWHAVLPAGVVLVIIHNYDALLEVRVWYLGFYLLFALLLVARVNFIKTRARWSQERTHLPPYTSFDLMRATVVAAVITMLLAWVSPAFASSLEPAAKIWNTLTQPWQEAREEIGKAFASLRASVGIVNDYYGETLVLGRGNALSDQVILNVETQRRTEPNVRFYWRSRVYSHFDGSEWKNILPEVENIIPTDFDPNYPDYEGRWKTTFDMTTQIPITTLYTVTQTNWISRPVDSHFAYNTDGSTDISALRSPRPMMPGETYSVESFVSSATIGQLKNAGIDYPEWVTERYLQLPEGISDRTLALAQAIAEDLENPYDIADAITEYLRDNIEYNTLIPSRPNNVDPIDWFLFDIKEGFCNYYATAQVILLRSLGIPTRMAVGYAQGEMTLGPEYIEVPADQFEFLQDDLLDIEYFTVRQKDAHAWPEVFFPGVGWVEFEPTRNQVPILRTIGEDSPESESDASENRPPPLAPSDRGGPNEDFSDISDINEDRLSEEEQKSRIRTLWIITFIASVVLILTALTWRAIKRSNRPLPELVQKGFKRFNIPSPALLHRWAFRSALTPMARAYLEINRALLRLKSPPSPNNTPSERAETLVSLLPTLETPIRRLRDCYHTSAYSARVGDLQQAIQASRLIRNTSYLAVAMRWLGRWREPSRKRIDSFFSSN